MAKTTKKNTSRKNATKKTAVRSTAGKKKVTKVTKAKAKATAAKRKPIKAPKDGIDRPTRNRTAYIMFTNDARPSVQNKTPKMSFVDVTRAVAAQWRALSDKERKPYIARAEKDKERYKREVDKFKEEHPDEPLTIKKKKRVTKIKGPKKARSAYVFYTIEARPGVQSENEDMDFGQITKRVAEAWNGLSSKQKLKYEKMAEKDRVRYEKEAAVFNEEHPEVARRKKRAKKDAPKKARSAYLYFTMERRPELKKTNDDMVFGDLTRLVAKEWRKLSDAGKRKFNKLAAADKKRYAEEMEDYTPPTDEELDAEMESSKKKRRTGPKRPRTGYVYFTMDQRPHVQQENADLKFGDITKILATEWKALSESDREKYAEQAAADKTRYQRECEALAA